MGSTTAPILLGGGDGHMNAISKNKLLVVVADFTMSASYATGGDTVTLSTKVKGSEFRGLAVLNFTDATRIYAWDGNKTTPKIIAYVVSTGAEVAAAVDLSTKTITAVFIYEGA